MTITAATLREAAQLYPDMSSTQVSLLAKAIDLQDKEDAAAAVKRANNAEDDALALAVVDTIAAERNLNFLAGYGFAQMSTDDLKALFTISARAVKAELEKRGRLTPLHIPTRNRTR